MYLGDRLVASKSDNYFWQVGQDITLTITYPQAGVTPAIVNYAEVTVGHVGFLNTKIII